MKIKLGNRGSDYMTPHNSAKKEDVAKTVIMPGDPKRAKFIAENYLTDYKLVNEVRCAFLYTGCYKDKKVSIMASGMGMPSMGIYAYELFQYYDVDNIIRLGSCQSRDKNILIGDIILSDTSYTDSNFSHSYALENVHLVPASEKLNELIEDTSKELNIHINKGLVWTSDLFYHEKDNKNEYIDKAIGLEMETFALLYLANKLKKDATSILTVSDSLYTDKELTSEEREKSFDKAIRLALESIK